MTHTKQLNAKTLGDLDNGKAGKMITEALRTAVVDCIQRRSIKSRRRVTIMADISPDGTFDIVQAGTEYRLKIDVAADVQLPGRGTDLCALRVLHRLEPGVTDTIETLIEEKGDEPCPGK